MINDVVQDNQINFRELDINKVYLKHRSIFKYLYNSLSDVSVDEMRLMSIIKKGEEYLENSLDYK